MSTPVTAAVLYDLISCPHRVTMDAFGDPAERDPINAFVELLCVIADMQLTMASLAFLWLCVVGAI